VIREMLDAHPEIEVVAECSNGFEGVRTAVDRKPDLMFLDVQMPKLDGFEALELLEGKIAVIFVTAYDAHAMRAFEVHAVESAETSGRRAIRSGARKSQTANRATDASGNGTRSVGSDSRTAA
jgi:chemotaxis response regulator CheB